MFLLLANNIIHTVEMTHRLSRPSTTSHSRDQLQAHDDNSTEQRIDGNASTWNTSRRNQTSPTTRSTNVIVIRDSPESPGEARANRNNDARRTQRNATHTRPPSRPSDYTGRVALSRSPTQMLRTREPSTRLSNDHSNGTHIRNWISAASPRE